jgi:hypothetical protein
MPEALAAAQALCERARLAGEDVDKLAAALACVEDMRICGRRLIDRELYT